MSKDAILLYQKSFNEKHELTNLLFSGLDLDKNSFEIKKDEKVVCSAFINEKKLCVDNKKFSFPFLFGLSTHADFRNFGYAREILKKILLRLKISGRAFLLLYPFPVDKIFYEKFDFSSFSFVNEIPLFSLVISGSEIKENVPCFKIKNLYQKIMKKYACFQSFSGADFSFFDKKIKAFGGKKIGFFYKNYLYGYVTLDGDAIEDSFFDYEFINENKDNLSGEIFDKNSPLFNAFVYNFINKSCPDKIVSYALIRPINYISFLRVFKGNFDLSSPFTLKLLIKDALLKDAKIKICVKNKKIRFYEDFNGEDYVTLSVKEFTDFVLFSKTKKGLKGTNKTVFNYAFFDKY